MCESVRAKTKTMEAAESGRKESGGVPTKSECGDYNNDIRSQAPSMRSQVSKSVGGNRLPNARVYHVDHSAKMNPTEEEWNNIV